MKTFSTEKIKKILYSLISLAFWLGLWILAAKKAGSSLLLPGPYETLSSLCRLAGSPEFWLICLKSMLRVITGTLCGTVTGIICAIICHSSKLLNSIFSPAVRIIKTTPVASFIILAMLWLGRSILPSFISALMVFPSVFQNVLTGIEEIPENHRKLVYIFRPSYSYRLFKIYLPDVFPYFISALRTALGISWKAGIAAEVLSFSPDSIGRQLNEAKNLLETADLFAWTAAVIIISLIIETVINLIFEKKNNSVSGKEHKHRVHT